MSDFDRSMIEMFTFEMSQLLQHLEQNIVQGDTGYSMDGINEIFRVMHTIKGSAAMMEFTGIAVSAHAIEDLFFYLREENPSDVDFSKITDLVLSSVDFIKEEIAKIEADAPADGDDSENIARIKEFLNFIKGGAKPEPAKPDAQPASIGNSTAEVSPEDVPENANVFDVVLRFDDGCEMENVRAFTVVHNIKDHVISCASVPENLIDEASIDIIRANGLKLKIVTYQILEELREMLAATIYLKELSIEPEKHDAAPEEKKSSNGASSASVSSASAHSAVKDANQSIKKAAGSSMISVNVGKLDDLLKLMGELVISEAMVTQNPELEGLALDGFYKEARQLKSIIKEMQNTIMSLRMVPLSATFFKMNRIVRDMCKQLGKDIQLEIYGEETEVDKNIIEHIADPIMHIIRNSADHGIELPETREAGGKDPKGTISLEAESSGSDVIIRIRDDGAGLNKAKILNKAKNNGMLTKPENEYSDKEIFQFVFMPGFSTNEKVTEFSGRGVGMDVVFKNLELVNGQVFVDSTPGEGSTFTMKIPLTLAIIDGMLVTVGDSKFTLPILAIRDSFKPRMKDIFLDPNGNEMITVRGEVYNIVRLYEFFGMTPKYTNPDEGIMIMLENGDQIICLFVDTLLGQQQVVLKNMPKYIGKVKGISGCTLLGNGDISLILDVAGFFDK